MSEKKAEQGKDSTRILQARFPSGEAFLADLRGDEDDDRVIYYATRIPLAPHEQVIVEVLFPELPSRTLLRGQVESREEDPPAVLIRFAREESETVDFVISVARGETDPNGPRGRRYYRIPLEIPVDWQIDGHRDVVISSTDDVSGGGVQIRTQNPPPVGTDVVIVLSLDEQGVEQVRVPGTVAWVRTDESYSRMGVRFTAESSEEKKRLRDLVRKFMESGEIIK